MLSIFTKFTTPVLLLSNGVVPFVIREAIPPNLRCSQSSVNPGNLFSGTFCPFRGNIFSRQPFLNLFSSSILRPCSSMALSCVERISAIFCCSSSGGRTILLFMKRSCPRVLFRPAPPGNEIINVNASIDRTIHGKTMGTNHARFCLCSLSDGLFPGKNDVQNKAVRFDPKHGFIAQGVPCNGFLIE